MILFAAISASLILTPLLPAQKTAHAALPPLNQGTSLLNNLASGNINANSFIGALTGSGNMNMQQATSFTNALIGNQTANFGAMGNLVNNVLSGNINPTSALGMAGLGNLGNISNIQNLAQIANNPLIQQGLQQALGQVGLGGMAKQLSSIFGGAATPNLVNSILQQAGMPQQLSQMISGFLGGNLTQMLGGLSNLTNLLSQGLNLTQALNQANAAAQQQQEQQNQQQQNQQNNVNCARTCTNCCTCHTPIVQNHKNIRAHMTNQFEAYRLWLVSRWYVEYMVPALMTMTSQMTAAALHQIEMLGTLLDAKHQLETQRLFQEMTARAHKNYHPSEGLCEFGTNTRSLAASERRADLSKTAFSQRMVQRSLKAGDIASSFGQESDKASRIEQFRTAYCDPHDNARFDKKPGLEPLCKGSSDPKRKNKDVDFTHTIDAPLSLDIDFLKTGNTTEDEQDVFALSSNLYAHDVPEKINRHELATSDGRLRPIAYPLYMDLRAVIAKRSVAQNSFAAITAMKSRGAKDVAPFMKAFVKDLGLEEEEIHKLIGEEPSYFAQMEVLTKKIYENPNFYADLYDKPTNVERKIAVMEALEIMQDRDIYDSLLRSEAVLAVYLETLLTTEHDRARNTLRAVTSGGSAIDGAGGGQ